MDGLNDLVYTDGELADLLKISRSTVRRLWWRGELPKPIKVGAVVRWRQSDIHSWLESKEPHGLYDDGRERQMV